MSPSESEYTVRDDEITDISKYKLAKWANPERRTIRDQVRDNMSVLSIIALIGVFGAILVTAWIAPFVHLGSLYTWAPFGVLAVVLLIFYAGARWMRGQIADYTFVVAKLEDSAQLVIAKELPYGEHRYAVYKSWILPGINGDLLRIEDLSSKLARKADTQYEEGDPVVLRLKPAYTASVDTSIIGTIYVTRGHSLDIDKYSDDSQLTVTHPDSADESTLEDLNQQLESERQEKWALERKVTALQQQLERAQHELSRSRDQHVDDFLDRLNKAREQDRRRAPRTSQSDEYGSLDNEGDGR